MEECWVVICHWVYLDEDEVKGVFRDKNKAIEYAKKIAEEEEEEISKIKKLADNRIMIDLGESWIEIVKTYLY